MQIVGEESNHERVRLSGQMYINAMANAFQLSQCHDMV